jgi:hypothetical protein
MSIPPPQIEDENVEPANIIEIENNVRKSPES